MTVAQAVMKLVSLGYCFEVAEDKVRYRYDGKRDPNPDQVGPLLKVVKAHKEETLYFLNYRCPRCGEVVFPPQGKCYSCLERHAIQKEHLGKCVTPGCVAPAWDTDTDGKEKCWCCLAKPGLFGTH
jgi:hypothetical protein